MIREQRKMAIRCVYLRKVCKFAIKKKNSRAKMIPSKSHNFIVYTFSKNSRIRWSDNNNLIYERNYVTSVNVQARGHTIFDRWRIRDIRVSGNYRVRAYFNLITYVDALSFTRSGNLTLRKKGFHKRNRERKIERGAPLSSCSFKSMDQKARAFRARNYPHEVHASRTRL